MKYSQVKISDVADVFNGKTPSKIEQRTEGLPILKIKDIDENGNFREVFESFVDIDFYKRFDKKKLKPGDTIVLNAAHNSEYVGSKNAYIIEKLDGIIATGEWMIIRPVKSDKKYVNQFIKSTTGRNCLKTYVKGIHLYPKDVEKIKIPLPPLDDQIRIAEILSRAEQLIAKRKESIALLDEFLKSTFLEMFGDPVRNEKRWEKVRLGDAGTLDRGISKHRPRNAPELLGGNYPLIQTGEVANAGIYIKKYSQTYSENGFKQSKMWKKGTLCITIAANIARTGILTFDACFPDSVVGYIPKKNVMNVLFVHFLFSFFQGLLEKNAPQAAQKNINLYILRNLEVPFPPIVDQNNYTDIVERVELIKSKYQQSLDELENLYGSLSQRAFKGELDLGRVSEYTEGVNYGTAR